MKHFAVAIALLAAACGGSDSTNHDNGDDDGGSNGSGSNMTSTCGDGVVDVATEQCDDGNTTNGDGCSSTCKIEVVNKCGNGALDSGEVCDDGNTASNDGCSATCMVEAGYMCTGTPSVCTMMPVQSGTGTCADPFTIALNMTGGTYSAMVMGDTTSSTDQVAAAACDSISSSGAAPDHQWKLVNPTAQAVQITVSGLDSADDATLRLMTTACDNTTAVADDNLTSSAHADGCSDLHAGGTAEVLQFHNLPAGTYYIDVDGYHADDYGPYTLAITASVPVCGNGTIELGETCDDGNTMATDGCDAACQIETGYSCTGTPSVCVLLCGNGMIDDDEDCDDGNTMANDGCDATCHTENGWDCGFDEPSVCTNTCGDGILDYYEECDVGTATDPHCNANCEIVFDTHEVTTNDNDGTNAQMLTPTSQWIGGSFTAGDIDVYKFTLTATATVSFETFDQYDPTTTSDSASAGHLFCNYGDTGIDTQIRLFDDPAKVTDNTQALFFDDDDGAPLCSYIGPDNGDSTTLPAGTYYIKVNLYSATKTAFLYGVQMTVTP
ncbi:MAG: DUF4215 domain-containing protein [Kofleriaceae bacterium]